MTQIQQIQIYKGHIAYYRIQREKYKDTGQAAIYDGYIRWYQYKVEQMVKKGA